MSDLLSSIAGYAGAAIVMAWVAFWIFMFAGFLFYVVVAPILETVLL